MLPWLQNTDALSAIGSVGALIISVIALVISHRSSTAQELRQKREELRGLIEKLISLREDLNLRISKVQDPYLRVESNKSNNTMRAICLQSAERLAAELADDVSSSEYGILAQENWFESDFAHTMIYYGLAVDRSQRSSVFHQAVALRALGSGYYAKGPVGDIEAGRRTYEKLVSLIPTEARSDPYMLFTQVENYQAWAEGELRWGNRDKAAELLGEAQRLCALLPAWFFLKFDAMRSIAVNWSTVASSYFPGGQLSLGLDPSAGRTVFQGALDLLRPLTDDNTAETRGSIYQEWARVELLGGDAGRTAELAGKAEACYASLPAQYPGRDERLRTVRVLLSVPSSAESGVDAEDLTAPLAAAAPRSRLVPPQPGGIRRARSTERAG